MSDREVSITTHDEAVDFLKSSGQPVFYVSRTALNVLGLDDWISGFRYVALVDSWDGGHPNVFIPKHIPNPAPLGNEEIVNWLLNNPEVREYIAAQTPAGFRPQILATKFDSETEQICERLGYQLILPEIGLREHVDSKIVTTQIGNQAGVSSVPNIMTEISGYEDLIRQSTEAGLGEDLVLQLAQGEAGRTTFFVSDENSYLRVESQLQNATVKVMKRINHVSLAVEAIITERGIIVGPVLREIVGFEDLTRFPGAWCGSEMYPGLLSQKANARCLNMTHDFCRELAKTGYRGTLDLDFLLDTDTGELFLGELNARISGSASHSNLTAHGKTLPLYAYHVLVYSGANLDFDYDALNRERAKLFARETWSTMNVHHLQRQAYEVTESMRTGTYRVSETGELEFLRPDLNWQSLAEADEVFFLRITGPGDTRNQDADLGTLVTRVRMQTDDKILLPHSKQLAQSVRDSYAGAPVSRLKRYWRGGVRRIKAALGQRK